MTDLTRRGFLKAIGGLAAGAIVLPSLRLIVPSDQPLLGGEKWLANVRELSHYALNFDAMILRHDILVRGHQFSVDSKLTDKASLLRSRKQAAVLLGDLIRHNGWTAHDLEPLPIPRGYYGHDIIDHLELS
jgi:hypothetical protein